MMVDLVVRGDTVVTPQGVGAYDIAITGEQIEQNRIVGLGSLLGRVGPVAAPQHALRRSLHVPLRQSHHVGIARSADLRVLVRAGELDPGLALLDQLADHAECRVTDAG